MGFCVPLGRLVLIGVGKKHSFVFYPLKGSACNLLPSLYMEPLFVCWLYGDPCTQWRKHLIVENPNEGQALRLCWSALGLSEHTVSYLKFCKHNSGLMFIVRGLS